MRTPRLSLRPGRALGALAVAAAALVSAAPAGAARPPVAGAPVAANRIMPGVTVGGVPVGGMTQGQARAAVSAAYLADVPLAIGKRRFRATARQLGFHVYVAKPVRVAFAMGRPAGSPVSDVPVVTRLAGSGMRRYVAYLQRLFDREAVDATLALRGTTPAVVPDAWGRELDRADVTATLLAALRDTDRPLTRIPFSVVRPQVTTRSVGYGIVIDRGAHSLTLYRGSEVVHSFGVAVGQPVYPTPTGSFHILDKQLNPWWYPPNDAWAAGEKPVPPGPGNPLGTRWMGIGDGVGIHGTPDAASIGYSASHGCIRMQIPDAEWLFERVQIGTPVWIVD